MEDRTYRIALEAPVAVPPRRVVSLVPSVTESLFDLALGDRVIAVTNYCVYPAAETRRLPHVGGTKNPNVEQIIALQPDLVICNQEENRREDVEALQSAGIPVWVTFPQTVQDAMNLLWAFMEVFDEPSMVPRVRLIEQTVDFVERIGMSRETPCRVFVPIWYEPWMTFNSGTFAHDLLRVCGGVNVFADRERRYPLEADIGGAAPYAADDPRMARRDTRYPRVTLDEVEALQPDVILLPSEPYAFDQTYVGLFKNLNVPASKADRIHLVDGSLLTWHGTRIAHALTVLPALLCSMEPGDVRPTT